MPRKKKKIRSLEHQLEEFLDKETQRPYKPKTKSNTHITPEKVYEIIEKRWGWKKEEMFDPCPAVPAFDGLEIDWSEKNYVNPEFAVKKLTAFLEKAMVELAKRHESIFLLPSGKTDQAWFHDIILANRFEIEWIRGRLHFANDRDSSTDAHFLVKISNDLIQ